MFYPSPRAYKGESHNEFTNIQPESPGMDKESNWLPAPKSGELNITMRLYSPKIDALDGRWNPPAIKRIK
jgi:hypothetical protein